MKKTFVRQRQRACCSMCWYKHAVLWWFGVVAASSSGTAELVCLTFRLRKVELLIKTVFQECLLTQHPWVVKYNNLDSHLVLVEKSM